jgi:hypothetical protein
MPWSTCCPGGELGGPGGGELGGPGGGELGGPGGGELGGPAIALGLAETTRPKDGANTLPTSVQTTAILTERVRTGIPL